MNARAAIERHWAALCVRQPAVRHTLLKYLRAYGYDGSQVTFQDVRAALIYRAVVLYTLRQTPITPATVGAYLARFDFSLGEREAQQFVAELAASVPLDIDVERLALGLLVTFGIHLPEYEIEDYLNDPLGTRAGLMRQRKEMHAR